MKNPLFLNDAVRSVEWHDLRAMSLAQTIRANFLSVPWLIVSLVLAHEEYYLAALPFSAIFFMAGLRQTHDGMHVKLGLPTALTHAIPVLFSMLMAIPLHAVRWIHLRHHANPLGNEDVEGMCARMPWWMAIVAGPYFSIRMIIVAIMRSGGWTRMMISVEVAATLLLLIVAVALGWTTVQYQLFVMVLGNSLTGFVAVWMVHRECERDGLFARTQRSRLINFLTVNNFYHLEHHLFPAVASCNLPELARRLDRVLPTAAPVVALSRIEETQPNAASDTLVHSAMESSPAPQ